MSTRQSCRSCSSPSLIEGISTEAVAIREFGIGVGPADLLIVDVDGSITVVECKLLRAQRVGEPLLRT